MKGRLAAFLAGACVTAAAFAGDENEREVFGWIETADLVEAQAEVKIKMDTGALTSSLHAENIERFKKDDEKWVRFETTVEDQESGDTVSHTYEVPLYRNVVVVGAGGKERRPVVLLEMCIGDTIYEEQFSLENRDDLTYPVLVGRRTIQHLGLIDVTRTFTRDPECGDDATVSRQDERESDDDIGI